MEHQKLGLIEIFTQHTLFKLALHAFCGQLPALVNDKREGSCSHFAHHEPECAALTVIVIISHSIFIVTMQGVDVLHGCGLLHLDMKADNANGCMQPDGSHLELAILDLGSARPTGCCKSGLHLLLHSEG